MLIKTILAILILGLSVAVAQADVSKTFAWDAVTTPVAAESYRLYRSDTLSTYIYGTDSVNYRQSVNAPTVQMTETIPDGTYYYVVTAYAAANGESVASCEIKTVVSGLTITWTYTGYSGDPSIRDVCNSISGSGFTISGGTIQ